jgi:hypothetical protein
MTAKEAAKPGGLHGLGRRRKVEPGDVTVFVEGDVKCRRSSGGLHPE